jgi:pimeloyl-ACP methyl ester carboxylesterase
MALKTISEPLLAQFVTMPSGTVARYCDWPASAASQLPPVLLLHGANLSLESWEPWLQRLEGAVRLIAVDLPGHGLTGAIAEGDYSLSGMVAFVDAFTRCLRLDQPFVLAGHSYGGEIAWRFAIQHPERIAKLILVAPAGLSEAGGPSGRIYRLVRRPLGPLLLHLLASRERFAAGLRATFYDEALVTPDMIERCWQFSRRRGTPAATIARIRSQRLEPAMIARLGEIRAPTLILWGRDDPVFPAQLGNVLTKSIPNARLIGYESCGHHPMAEQSERTSSDVIAFLKGHAELNGTRQA